jgi:hypothetical protein
VCHEAQEIWELLMCFLIFLWEESKGGWGFAEFARWLGNPAEARQEFLAA